MDNIHDNMDWIVRDVKPQSDFTLYVTFDNGAVKIYDMKPKLIHQVYAPLRNIALFMNAHADGWTVAWDDDIDIAPEELYLNGMEVNE